jgi:hypothetical protein
MKRYPDSWPVAYVAFGAFVSALDDLSRSSLTGALSRAECGAVSNSTWSQLTRTLRFFNLIDDDNVPTESLKSLVRAPNRKPILRALLKRHYPDLFSVDLSRLRLSRLEKLLADRGISGATLSRARSFFLGAARYSGIRLSPELSRIIRQRVKRPPRAQHTERRNPKHINVPLGPQASVNDTVSLTVRDMNFSLSFPRDFAKLTSAGREHLYHLLDEAVLLSQRFDQSAGASGDRDRSQMADVDIVAGDPNDAAIH